MNTKDSTPHDKEPTDKTTLSLNDLINSAKEVPENEFLVTAADYLQRKRIKDEEAGFGTMAATSLIFTGIEPLTPELLNLVKPPKSFVPTVRILKEDSETVIPNEKKVKPKSDLTERLLIIRYLQKENLFPVQFSEKGQTETQFRKFISILLAENENAVKSSLQRVDKIMLNKDTTKENKTDRLLQLNNVLEYFKLINQTSISGQIQSLIDKINNTLFR